MPLLQEAVPGLSGFIITALSPPSLRKKIVAAENPGGSALFRLISVMF